MLTSGKKQLNKPSSRKISKYYLQPQNTYFQLATEKADSSFFIHARNLRSLAVELFKVVKGFRTDIL